MSMKILSLGLTYSEEARTLRAAKISNVIGTPTEHLTGLRTSLPMPATTDQGLRESNVIQTLTEAYWIFLPSIPAPDIEVGDHVEVNSVAYIVRVMQTYQAPKVLSSPSFIRLTAERIVK